MAPMRHILKRQPKRASMSLSSFLSNVLLLEGTFIEFIITCSIMRKKGINEKMKTQEYASRKRKMDAHKVERNPSINIGLVRKRTFVSCPVNITAPTIYSVFLKLQPYIIISI